MKNTKKVLKFLLWLIFFITFATEFVKIMFELNPAAYGHKPLSMANAFFWSCLFMIEMIMAGFIIYYFLKYPVRRGRLLVLSMCHFSVILLLPVVLNDWSWTCLLYPWPHTLQAFDPKTPVTAFIISTFMGFLIVPVVTYRWGVKGFCGYLCPHGAFFSETYGRIFSTPQGRLQKMPHAIPKIYFLLMVVCLVVILLLPNSVVPIRSGQKLVYFLTAEFFYFVIGIPLLGGRSYCRLICPMGYFVLLMVRLKRKWKKTT